MSSSDHSTRPKIKVVCVYPDKTELPSYEFERLIIEHYKKYPRTAAMVEKPQYIRSLLHPFRRFYGLPAAFVNLKMNTVLNLKWLEYLKLWVYIVLLSIPNMILAISSFVGVTVTTPTNEQKAILGDVIFSVVIPLLVAVLLSLFYLKYSHDGYLGLILAKRVEWIEKPVHEYYKKYYDRKFPANSFIILGSIITAEVFTIPMLRYSFVNNIPVAQVFGIVACVVNPLLMYIFWLATVYMIRNNKIYAHVLRTIKTKLAEYVDGYGSLLSKENYDVIWALGDTPGRSIRQLENIPVAGVISALIITIAMFLGGIDQVIYGIYGRMPPLNFSFWFIKQGAPWTVLVSLMGFIISIILVLIQAIPIYAFSVKMKKFKIKALLELDNYIFASVVEFEKRYADFARQETVTMFSLREYIASMKTIPISVTKIIQTITAVVLWFLNIRKIFRAVAGGA
ncbi:MAG: hypothetical protein ACTSYD_00190 [Candidatus Heimdallarchaeaceae archaeon]